MSRPLRVESHPEVREPLSHVREVRRVVTTDYPDGTRVTVVTLAPKREAA